LHTRRPYDVFVLLLNNERRPAAAVAVSGMGCCLCVAAFVAAVAVVVVTAAARRLSGVLCGVLCVVDVVAAAAVSPTATTSFGWWRCNGCFLALLVVVVAVVAAAAPVLPLARAANGRRLLPARFLSVVVDDDVNDGFSVVSLLPLVPRLLRLRVVVVVLVEPTFSWSCAADLASAAALLVAPALPLRTRSPPRERVATILLLCLSDVGSVDARTVVCVYVCVAVGSSGRRLSVVSVEGRRELVRGVRAASPAVVER
jgi:hypothetical protein